MMPSSEARSPSIRAKIPVIEGLRGLAAFSVAWFHFTNGNQTYPSNLWLRGSGVYGWLGVEIFFVISGFIIPFAMNARDYRISSMPTFLAKRLLRLEPPYMISIALTLVLWWASSLSPGFSRPAPSTAQVLLHLGYLNTFFGYDWINTAYWTLAIEFQYYLLMAMVYPLVSHSELRVRIFSVCALCALTFLFPSERFVFRYLGLFALGITTFQWHSGLLSRKAFLLFVAAITGLNLQVNGPVIASAGVATALMIAFASGAQWRPLSLLGMLSYSLYLVHGPLGGRVVNLGARYTTGPAGQIAVMFIALGACLVAAYAMYRLIELPSLKYSASLRYDRLQS